jgi:hypothetical protein
MNSVIALLAAFGLLSLVAGAVTMVVGIFRAPEGRETEDGLEIIATPAHDRHDISADHMHVA